MIGIKAGLVKYSTNAISTHSIQPKQQQNKKKHTMAKLQPIEISADRKLTEDDLPTEAQLKALFEQKGKEAVVAFAYRNAVRVLPLMAVDSFERVWDNGAVKHSFAIIRALALLNAFLRGNRQKVDFHGAKVGDAAFRAAYLAKNDITIGAKTAAANAANTAEATKAVDPVGNAKATAANAVNAVNAANAANAAVFVINSADLKQATLLHIIKDFNALVTGTESAELLAQSLWETLPKAIRKLQINLLDELARAELSFLASDVKALLASQAISPERANIYNETLKGGDDILNKPARLRALFEGNATTKENPAVRVLLVGPGGAGKTSLFNLLHNRQKSPSGKPTISINTQPINLDVHRKAGVKVDIEFDEKKNAVKTNKIEVTQWDFGGQSTFYNLHRGFMRRENCVYVLVVDSRHEQAPDEWLTQIQHYAQGDGSSETVRVLVVTNAYEGIEREQNHSYLTRKFSTLLTPIDDKFNSPFFTFNCTEPDDPDGTFNHFVEALLHACRGSQRNVMDITRPGIDWLIEQFKTGKKSITLAELEGFYAGQNVYGKDFVEEKESLEDLGHLVDLYKQSVNDKSDYLVLDTKWITSVAYLALNHGELKHCGGIISLSAFKRSVLGKLEGQEGVIALNNEDKNMVIDFLLMQGVAYRFTENKPMLFFPDAAPAAEPSTIERLLNNASSDDSPLQTLTVEYHLPAFPMGLKSFLAIRLVKKGVVALQQESVNVWRDGLLASFDNQVQIIVFYHQAKHKVELNCVYSGEPEQLAKPIHTLHMLINNDNIRGSNPKVLPLLRDEENNSRPDGHTLRDAIFHLLPGYQTMATIKNPEPVYLSYAWGREDDTHQKIADAIAKALGKESDIQLMRDKDVMQNGDSIIEFEKRIGRAYQVIVIFSAKSLSSEHCMRELAYLQKTSLNDKAHFQERIIPVILDEVSIGNSIERKAFSKYWKGRAAELKDDTGDVNDPELVDSIRLYNTIANSIFSSLTWSADILIKPESTLSANSDDQTHSPGTADSPDTTHSREFDHLIDLIKRRIRDNQHKLLQ